jgi:hypothetical protein
MLHPKGSKLAIFAAVCLWGIGGVAQCTEASATIITDVWTGKIVDGFDYTGVFGPANTDLTGLPYELIIKWDTSKGIFLIGPSKERLYGGPAYGTPMSPGSATVIINGVSIDIYSSGSPLATNDSSNSENLAYRWSLDNNTLTSIYQTVQDFYTIDGVMYNYNTLFHDNYLPGYYPYSIFGPFYTENLPCGGICSEVQIREYNIADGVFTRRAEADFLALTMAINVLEPSTSAMMLLGFAGLGFAGYRRARAGYDATLAA